MVTFFLRTFLETLFDLQANSKDRAWAIRADAVVDLVLHWSQMLVFAEPRPSPLLADVTKPPFRWTDLKVYMPCRDYFF